MMMSRNEETRTTMSVVPLTVKEDESFVRSHPDDLATEEVDGRKRFKRKRSPTTSFPIILYDLLQEAESKGYSNTISWLPDGARFQIHQPAKFRDEIMTKYFRQTKLESFTRQLYIYGFSKDAGFKKEDMVFAHQEFQRGNIDACRNIGRNQSGDRRVKRKEAKSSGSASIVQLQQAMVDQRRQNDTTASAITADQRRSRNAFVPSWLEDNQEGELGTAINLASGDTNIRHLTPFNGSERSTTSTAVSNLDLEPRPIEEMLHDYRSFKKTH
ncbi:unnamed protein product [Cylindrotheca closterium]|uniref:HSF-type DNA-binding domain-containing protein n=1 Tax=Cylindrotheca closterium TaxID=2856 RepID=A0AAD2CG62_9STRA|nr:unnamed protein product [Cylindrotheca closterium]